MADPALDGARSRNSPASSGIFWPGVTPSLTLALCLSIGPLTGCDETESKCEQAFERAESCDWYLSLPAAETRETFVADCVRLYKDREVTAHILVRCRQESDCESYEACVEREELEFFCTSGEGKRSDSPMCSSR